MPLTAHGGETSSWPAANWLTFTVKDWMPLLVLRHSCLLQRKISVAGASRVYRVPRSAMNWTIWLPGVQLRSGVHLPSVKAAFDDSMSLGNTMIPHSGSVVLSPQALLPTPTPLPNCGLPFASGRTVESTSNGSVIPLSPLSFPFAITDAVSRTPLSTAEYETENDWLDTFCGKVICDGLKLPRGLPPAARVGVRLSGVSLLNTAPSGVRLTVSVNVAPACTRTAGTAPPPPKPSLSVDATAVMPVGAIMVACALGIAPVSSGRTRPNTASAAILRLRRGI